MIKNPALMNRLKNGAARSSKQFDINDRAVRVYNFMELCSK